MPSQLGAPIAPSLLVGKWNLPLVDVDCLPKSLPLSISVSLQRSLRYLTTLSLIAYCVETCGRVILIMMDSKRALSPSSNSDEP